MRDYNIPFPKKTYDTRLGQILETKGMTQRQLADMTGISEAHISRLVAGNRNGKLYVWLRIAKALDLSLDDLIYVMEDDNNA